MEGEESRLKHRSRLSDPPPLQVCTKVASYLEQGQRLENLSWRLWHVQSLMVDSDNAKSKREFKKLSKCMGDKLDKEKGRYAPQTPTLGPTIPNEPIWPSIPRSIQELEAPDFKHNHSTKMIRKCTTEKEHQKAQSGAIIKRNQFTFSVEQPLVVNAAPAARKPDTKPSP